MISLVEQYAEIKVRLAEIEGDKPPAPPLPTVDEVYSPAVAVAGSVWANASDMSELYGC